MNIKYLKLIAVLTLFGFNAVANADVVVFEDDFESDLGWTIENDISLTGGAWERGVPAGDGTRGDPTTDFDGSGQCYLTENSIGNTDVDGGPTRLISPIIDLSGTNNPLVSYGRWFVALNTLDDRLDVEISADNGNSWTLIESVPHTIGWVGQTVRVADYIALTSQVQVRFSTADDPNNSLTEAAIDAFSIVDVPEPSSTMLLLVGMMSLLVRRR